MVFSGEVTVPYGTAATDAAAYGQIPAVVAGQYLCAPHQYAPATRTTFASTFSTFTAVASGTASTNAFTAPATGSVVVGASFNAEVSASGSVVSFALAATGTTTPLFGPVISPAISGASIPEHFQVQWYVTGLTAGSAYTFDLLQAVAAANTVTTVASGTASTTLTGEPVLMTRGGVPVTGGGDAS